MDCELDHGEGDNRPAKQRKDKPARDSLILTLQPAHVRGKALWVSTGFNRRRHWPLYVCRARSRGSSLIGIDVVGRHARRLPRWCDVPNWSTLLEPYAILSGRENRKKVTMHLETELSGLSEAKTENSGNPATARSNLDFGRAGQRRKQVRK